MILAAPLVGMVTTRPPAQVVGLRQQHLASVVVGRSVVPLAWYGSEWRRCSTRSASKAISWVPAAN